MFQNVPVVHSFDFLGTTLTLQTGLLAKQSTSTVLATMGETSILAAVVVGAPKAVDYFPLQVVYEERMYASGKIKGSRFIKREGRPSENAVLTGRMIDRSLRSLFDKNIRNEIQVVITVLSLDEINPPDLVAVLAASSVLKIATDEFMGPVSSIRIGQMVQSSKEVLLSNLLKTISVQSEFDNLNKDLSDACSVLDISDQDDKSIFKQIFEAVKAKDPQWAVELKNLYQQVGKTNLSQLAELYAPSSQYLVAPTYEQMSVSSLDLVVSGDGHNIMMVEAGANIIDEKELGQAFDMSVEPLLALTQFQKEFIQKAREVLGVQSVSLTKQLDDPKYSNYWKNFQTSFEEVFYNKPTKEARKQAIQSFQKPHFDILETICSYLKVSPDKEQEILSTIKDGGDSFIAGRLMDLAESPSDFVNLKSLLELGFEDFLVSVVHDNILTRERRIDGRDLDKTRQISCQIDVLPRVHGSSLFQRGETQVLNILTLGTTRDAQTLDEMEDFEEQTKRYIHHYNFPAYSVGETGRYSGPGRREIGHGALAEKALLPVLPSETEFPYTMRLVSECLGSNGSTSMASTCSSCLSLMAGGVPVKAMVAGVAMGLVLNSQTGEYKVLTDIMGDEDHYGDMSFKVAGTEQGITALQLDNKVAGLTVDILKKALIQAKQGRLHILGIMNQAISEPKTKISQYAPMVESLDIPIDKIGEIIGPSGKTIKALVAKYNVEIDIEDITGRTFIYGKNPDNVTQAAITIRKIIKEYQPGEVVDCKIFRLETYGAFVKIDDSEKEGMIHISNISSERVKSINDVFKMGQVLTAKILEINEKVQISLTLK